MVSGNLLSRFEGEPHTNVQQYRSIVGELQYANVTRPDISYSVNKVSQYMQQPLDMHWKAVKRFLRYLTATITFSLTFSPSKSLDLVAFTDADWTVDLDDRKSRSGYCIFLGDNLISWSLKKQAIVSRSSTEAEYRSLAYVICEVLWIRYLLQELRILKKKKKKNLSSVDRQLGGNIFGVESCLPLHN